MRLRNPEPGTSPVDLRNPRPARTATEVLAEAVLAVPHATKLVVRLLGDDRVPMGRKVLSWFAVAYVVSPIDIIPDFIPTIGMLDDVLVVAYALDRLLASVDRAVVAEAWDGSEDALDLVWSLVRWSSDLARAVFRLAPADPPRR